MEEVETDIEIPGIRTVVVAETVEVSEVAKEKSEETPKKGTQEKATAIVVDTKRLRVSF